MTYRIDLNPETQRAVEAAAARQGVSVEACIASAAESRALNEVGTNPLANALALPEALTPTIRAGTLNQGVPQDAAEDLEALRAESFANAGY